MKRAFYRVRVAGLDISSKLTPLLTAIEITDNEGQNSDTARITIDDAAGTIKFPRTGERIDIDLGWVGEDASAVFSGVVDEVRSSGSRGGGRELMISAKGMDAQGRAKEPQQRSFEGARDLRDVMERAGRDADVTEIIIAPELASVTRSWWGMNDESFLSFGERIAREVGGVFKIRNGQALLVSKTGGTASGGTIPSLRAAWGENLISWEVSPLMGRARHGRARARWYDRESARWREQTVEVTADPEARATTTNRYPRADQGDAETTSGSDASEVARQRGEGSVTIDGNAAARAGGPVSIVGARPGIDGDYRCKSVEHSYSRQGWVTKIDLQLPQGTAGTDSRRTQPNRRYNDFLSAQPGATLPPPPAEPPAPPADTPPTP